MIIKNKGVYVGYSDSSINEAIQNALQQVGEHTHFEVMETRGSHGGENNRHYQVTITAFFD